MYKTLLILLILLSGKTVVAQCSNKIEVVKASYSGNLGVIEVAVTTEKRFTCTLYIEKATGQEEVRTISGNATTKLKFEKLSPENLYRVEATFLNEEEKFCNKFSRSQITLTAK
ncbi:MAG: hypothetical protein MUF68_08290 [Cyclobacteriaceae bacterium]|nr:hypothetical protein [Cyclobacteriaceae bacterium]